jgi:hypothetical protein
VSDATGFRTHEVRYGGAVLVRNPLENLHSEAGRASIAYAALTRRRDHNRPQECWRVYYGDVHAGTIARCVGSPGAAPKWQWRCGFYPDSRPGECTGGTAASFDEARAAFETAWRIFLSKRAEADFQAWRDQLAWTAEKYRRFDRGERMQPDWRPA